MKNRTFKQWGTDALAIFFLGVVVASVTWPIVQEQRLSTSGRVATGTVLSKDILESRDESPDVFRIRYSFKDASGRDYRGSGSVMISVYRKTSPGDAITIEYVADDPGTNRIAGAFDPQSLYFLAFAVMAGGLFVYLGPRRWRREWRGEPDPMLRDRR